jgi:UDP-N-acetylmuramoylalanine--D-glutamate ligase
MQVEDKKIIVIGMGKTGIATAGFLGRRGAGVTVMDEKPPHQWGEAFQQIAGEPWLSMGGYNDMKVLEGVSMIVPSPGIPPDNPLLVEALMRHIPVISEIELAYRFIKVPMVAVAGTNGKTTTATLLGNILQYSGKKVFVGGNIGNPLIDYFETDQKDDFVVAEISSFQLQWIEKFRPFIAILLNITRDHVNYHGSFDGYRRAKARIFSRQTSQDYAILNAADKEQDEMTERIGARTYQFSAQATLPEGIYVENNNMVLQISGSGPEKYPVDSISLPGTHNVENVMASIIAARLCGCSQQDIIKAVTAFRGLPHRIEFAGEKKSVKFYDDSKGTNVGSVLRALETFSHPVVLLLGGRDKDGDFETLRPLLKTKARMIFVFGEARERIASLIGKDVPVLKAPTLKEAVENAYKNAEPGDVVLLSPGCASFDEFANYRERGNYFKDVVRNL